MRHVSRNEEREIATHRRKSPGEGDAGPRCRFRSGLEQRHEQSAPGVSMSHSRSSCWTQRSRPSNARSPACNFRAGTGFPTGGQHRARHSGDVNAHLARATPPTAPSPPSKSTGWSDGESWRYAIARCVSVREAGTRDDTAAIIGVSVGAGRSAAAAKPAPTSNSRTAPRPWLQVVRARAQQARNQVRVAAPRPRGSSGLRSRTSRRASPSSPASRAGPRLGDTSVVHHASWSRARQHRAARVARSAARAASAARASPRRRDRDRRGSRRSRSSARPPRRGRPRSSTSTRQRRHGDAQRIAGARRRTRARSRCR